MATPTHRRQAHRCRNRVAPLPGVLLGACRFGWMMLVVGTVSTLLLAQLRWDAALVLGVIPATVGAAVIVSAPTPRRTGRAARWLIEAFPPPHPAAQACPQTAARTCHH